MPRKITALFIIFFLAFEQSGFAQVAPQINIPAYLTGYLSPDRFRPVHLRSLSFDQITNNFNILLDTGDAKNIRPDLLKETTRTLFDYFKIGLTLPNSMLWVNLRPDDPVNIIDPYVEKTDLGKVLLEADLQLKKDMAACTSPDTREGKAYWNKLYAKAEVLFGQADIEIPTVTRPWIVPGEIIMAQSNDSAYVYKATLKVMLEQDYIKDAQRYNSNDARFKELNEYSSQLIREDILPKINREVNSAKRYAALRQVYYSLILAQWYKQNIVIAQKAGIAGSAAASLRGAEGDEAISSFAAWIDSRNLNGLTSKNQWSKQAYYQAYKKSFEKGEYNKEETVSSRGGLTIRRYFSGGINIVTPQLDGGIIHGPAIGAVDGGNIGITINPETLDAKIVDPAKIIAAAVSFKDGGAYRPDVDKLLKQLKDQDFIGQLEGAANGASYEAVKKIGNGKLAELGFEPIKGEWVNRLGWTATNLKAIRDGTAGRTLEEVISDGKELRDNFKYVIFCGMGGSGLSVQFVKDTFKNKEAENIFSLRTTDPTVITLMLKEIAEKEGSLKEALDKTAIVLVSKSATTPETVAHRKYFQDVFNALGLDTQKNLWFITDTVSPWGVEAQMNPAMRQREIQLNRRGDVGGRFTAPGTNVFLLPMAVVAPDSIIPIMDRAIAMNSVTDDTFLRLGAFMLHMAKDIKKDKLTIIVPASLKAFPMWLEQLIEESLGKSGKGITLFYDEPGLDISSIRSVDSNDRVFLRINMGDEKPRADFWKHIEEKGYPTYEIDLNDLNDIGGLMLGMQRAVAVFGYLWDICFVNQPAVEGYKIASLEMIKLIEKAGGDVNKVLHSIYPASSKKGVLTLFYDPLIKMGAIQIEDLKAQVQLLGSTMDDPAAVYAAIILLLKNRIEAGEFSSYGHMTDNLKEIFEEARAEVFTRGLKMSAKLGERPDANHSYHQNIADGKDMFLSTYFLPMEVIQPDEFELLKGIPEFPDITIQAQALGTVQSMIENKRKVMLITSDSTAQGSEVEMDRFFQDVIRYLAIDASGRDGGTLAFGHAALENVLSDQQKEWKKFGTSGLRGKVGVKVAVDDKEYEVLEDIIFPIATKAIAMHGKEMLHKGYYLLGGDPRKGNIEKNIRQDASILAANGMRSVVFVDDNGNPAYTPTPLLAALAKLNLMGMLEVDGTINNTASHNPKDDNGKKFSEAHGGAAKEATTKNIQKYIDRMLSQEDLEIEIMDYKKAKDLGLVKEILIQAALEMYVNEFLIKGMKDSGMWAQISSFAKANPQFKLIISPMQGAAVEAWEMLANELENNAGRKFIKLIHTQRNSDFDLVHNAPNPTEMSSIEETYEEVKKDENTMVLLTDGDADRFGIIDSEIVEANEFLAIYTYYYIMRNLEDIVKQGKTIPIGKTVATSNFVNGVVDYLNKFARYEYGADFNVVQLIEKAVGFKWFVEDNENENKEKKIDYAAAGEESAHMAAKPFFDSKDDGLAMDLLALGIRAETGKSLPEYRKMIEKEIGVVYHYHRDTIKYEAVTSTVEEAKALKDKAADLIKLTNTQKSASIAFQDMEVIRRLSVSGISLAVKDIITLDGVKIVFDTGDWLLIRLSGTENAARLYTEVTDITRQELFRAAGKELLGVSSSTGQEDTSDENEELAKSSASDETFARNEDFGLPPGPQVTVEDLEYLLSSVSLGKFMERKLSADYPFGEKNVPYWIIKRVADECRHAGKIDVNSFTNAAEQYVIVSAILFIQDMKHHKLWKQSATTAKDGGSVPVGGVDLRALPVIQQSGAAMLSAVVSGKDIGPVTGQQLESNWAEIEKCMKSGPMPYDMLKAYAISCCQNKEVADQREKFATCIANILKLEEQAAVPTAPELKEILVALS